MSDSDGSLQRDNRHHRWSRSRFPVSPGCAGDSLAAREERRLAEAVVPVRPRTGQPWAAPANPKLPAEEPRPAEEPPSSPFRPRPLQPHPWVGARVHRQLRPRPRQAKPRPLPTTPWPPACRQPDRRGSASPERLVGGRRSCSGGQRGRQVPRPRQPQPHPHPPPKAVPAHGRLPRGEAVARLPPAAHAYAAGHHAAAAATAAGRLARDPGGGGRRAGGAGYRPGERGAGDGRPQGGRRRTNAGDRPGRTRQGARVGAQPRRQGLRQRRGAEREQRTTRHQTQRTERARAREGHGHERQRWRTGARTWVGRQSGRQRGEGGGAGCGQRMEILPRTWTRTRKGQGRRRCQQAGGQRGRSAPELGPKDKGGKGNVSPWGQAGLGAGATGGWQGFGRGTRSKAPPQPHLQLLRCIPPGIGQMPAHHAHHHRHHHAHLYIIDPDAGDLVPPPNPPDPHISRPPTHTAARALPRPRGTRAKGRAGTDGRCPGGEGTWRGADAAGAGAGGGAGTGGRRGPGHGPGLRRDPGPPGGLGPPPGDKGVRVAGLGLLRDHQGNQKPALRCRVPPERRGEQRNAHGGVGGPGRPGSVLRAVIRAGWPEREPTWPALLEGGASLRITDAEANNWLSRACAPPSFTGATAGRTRHCHTPAPTQAAAQVTAAPGGDGPGRWAQGGGEGPATRDIPPSSLGPSLQSAPPTQPPLAQQRDTCCPQ